MQFCNAIIGSELPIQAPGTGVICEAGALPGAVIPAKAGIHSASHWKCAADGLDSRLRGNDRCFERGPIPNDTTTRPRVVSESCVDEHQVSGRGIVGRPSLLSIPPRNVVARGSGCPMTGTTSVATTSEGEQRCSRSGDAAYTLMSCAKSTRVPRLLWTASTYALNPSVVI